MPPPCIVGSGITGSLPTKENNPDVPISPTEQIVSTQEAFEADASIAFSQMRDDEGNPILEPARFATVMERLHKHCPCISVRLSTRRRSGAGHDRVGILLLTPDVISPSVGSDNFPTRVYENPSNLTDWLASGMLHEVKPKTQAFELSQVVQATRMQVNERVKRQLYEHS